MTTAPPPRDNRPFADREIARRGHHVHKIKAKDSSGRWAYYFILVEPRRVSAFMTAIEGDGMINLEDYGHVIASNYGEEPSDEIREMLKTRYGFNV